MISQDYLLEAESENVIRGNSAVLKCKIPSFVADFVSVQAWVDSEGKHYYPNNNYGNFRGKGSRSGRSLELEGLFGAKRVYLRLGLTYGSLSVSGRNFGCVSFLVHLFFLLVTHLT